jgi:tRNA pseudouridine55 synthase
MGMEKEYIGSLTLGATTPTYDLESEPQNFSDISYISEAEIDDAAKLFIGKILQVPPAHSAIKKDGKPVYLSARKGLEVVLEPRTVEIKAFEITKIESPKIFFKVICSTGTYIRSLANDFGKQLGVGAYLSSLCRTRIGDFTLEHAQTLQDFEAMILQLTKKQLERETNA